MSKYRILTFFWIVPAYLLFLVIQQGLVYQGVYYTYQNGDDYLAEVIDFDVKQIAAQSNGYIVITFTTDGGEEIERKLSLSIQMAQKLMDSNRVPIFHSPGSFQEVVMVPTYELQRSTSIYNLAVALAGLIVTLIAAFTIQKYINRKSRDGTDKFEIERMDQ